MKKRNYFRKRKREYEFDFYKKCRNEVLKRDKYSCQMCGSKKRMSLEVHHVIRWADSIHMRYASENCICLCISCHKQVTGNETIYQQYLFNKIYANIKRQNDGG